MAALPAWKLALLERKKKQEEEAKAKQVQVEEAKIASLPPWKRAILLREKQANGVATAPTTAAASKLNFTIGSSTARSIAPNNTSNKWQVAVERVKGPDSPILKQKPKWQESEVSATTKPASRNQVTQRWKHAFASTKKPAVNFESTSATVPSPAPVPSLGQDNDLSGMPAWKRALILKKRNQQVSSVASTSTVLSNGGTDEPDSAEAASTPTPKSQQPKALKPQQPEALKPQQPEVIKPQQPEVIKPQQPEVIKPKQPEALKPKQPKVIKPQQPKVIKPKQPEALKPKQPEALKPKQPEVVNRSAETQPSQRLVEQEGKTLRAPVYKEVDEWANVKEEDDKFKSLPLWKQALIKRRREDIAKRSGAPETVTSTEKNSPSVEAHSSNSTKAELKHGITNPRSANRSGEQKKYVGRLSSSNHKVASTKAVKDPDIKHPDSKPVRKAPVATRSGDLKPTRKAPEPPSTKKDPMFSYNFSKSTRHTLDTGASSSDSTDSELEDAIVTNLDDSSDEEDSGIVLQHYSVNKSSTSSPNMGQKSHSDTSVATTSVISGTGKKKGRHLRRVSWSDTQLVSEHFYPKYDYSDYEDIEHGETSSPPSTENSGLSHRLHPSLRPNNESDPYAYGFGSAHSPRSPPSDTSLNTFVPKALSSYSPQTVSSYSDRKQEATADESNMIIEVAVEEETDDFYADLASNTAALLW